MKKTTLFCFFLLFCFPKRKEIIYRDMIFLKNGEEKIGNVEKIDNKMIIFKSSEGKRYAFSLDSIISVSFGKQREGDTWKKIEDITDSLLILFYEKSTKVSKKYPSASYVTLYREEKISADTQSYIWDKREIKKILRESGKSIANNAYPYLSEKEICELLFARSITPDGRIHSISDQAIEDVYIYPYPPEYARAKQKKFAIPEAIPGALLDYKIRIKGNYGIYKPLFLDITLTEEEILDSSIVEIELSKKLPLKYYFTNIGPPATEEKEGKKIIKWWYRDTTGIPREKSMAPLSYFKPRIVAAPSAEWEEIAFHYKKVLNDSMEGVDEFLKEISPLLKKAYTKKDTIIKVYRYISDKIKTISSVNAPAYSYIPKSIKSIKRNGFANLLDKPYLLYAILYKLNYSPSFVLVPRKDKRYLIKEVPSLGQFDAAIIMLDDTLFLFPYENEKTGHLPGFLQGVEGLDVTHAKIIKTPLFSGDKEFYLIRAFLKNDGTIVVDETREIEGDKARNLRWLKELRKIEIDQLMEREIKSIHPNGILRNYELVNLFDPEKPLIIRVSYDIPDYATVAGDYIIFNLSWVSYSAEDVGPRKRQTPIFFTQRERITRIIEITYPKRFRIYYFPKNLSLSTKHFTHIVNFFEKRGKIYVEERFERKSTFVPKEEYQEYRKAKQKIAKFSEEILVLKKK